jgi:probable F420-dependent oxidoreductase
MQPPSGSAWTDHARRIESLGFDSLVMPDNIGHGLAVFPALAAAAVATSRLRLGSYVLANDVRHPVQVAKEAAALSALSDGRFELGLGAGRPGSEADNAMLGLPFDSPGTRVSRLSASVSIIKRLLAGETVSVTSEFYTISDASVIPPGTEPAKTRILIAGNGRRMLHLAGAEADTVALGVPFDADESTVADRIGWVREAAGDRDVELNLNLMAIGDAVPRYLAGRMDTAALAKSGAIGVVTGSPSEMAEQLISVRERLGISYIVVGAELIDAFVPVIERLR